MNKPSPILVRTWFVISLACVCMAVRAQERDRLVEDMSHKSAKERSKLAAQETAEAKSDSLYQHAMQKAEAAFRAEQYEEALTFFRQARELRPYNVYPKVKIQDLQALLKRREAAARPEGTPPPPPDAVAILDPGVRTPSASADPPRPLTKPVADVAVPPSAVDHGPALEARPHAPATPGERIYMEGGAVVTERTVMENEKPVVYKRVVQRSGQAFHFKDGLAVPAKTWEDRFR